MEDFLGLTTVSIWIANTSGLISILMFLCFLHPVKSSQYSQEFSTNISYIKLDNYYSNFD